VRRFDDESGSRSALMSAYAYAHPLAPRRPVATRRRRRIRVVDSDPRRLNASGGGAVRPDRLARRLWFLRDLAAGSGMTGTTDVTDVTDVTDIADVTDVTGAANDVIGAPNLDAGRVAART